MATRRPTAKPARAKTTKKPRTRSKPVKKPAPTRGTPKPGGNSGEGYPVWTYRQFSRKSHQDLVGQFELDEFNISFSRLTAREFEVQCYALPGITWVVRDLNREIPRLWARFQKLGLGCIFIWPGPGGSGTQGGDDPPPDPKEPVG